MKAEGRLCFAWTRRQCAIGHLPSRTSMYSCGHLPPSQLRQRRVPRWALNPTTCISYVPTSFLSDRHDIGRLTGLTGAVNDDVSLTPALRCWWQFKWRKLNCPIDFYCSWQFSSSVTCVIISVVTNFEDFVQNPPVWLCCCALECEANMRSIIGQNITWLWRPIFFFFSLDDLQTCSLCHIAARESLCLIPFNTLAPCLKFQFLHLNNYVWPFSLFCVCFLGDGGGRRGGGDCHSKRKHSLHSGF